MGGPCTIALGMGRRPVKPRVRSSFVRGLSPGMMISQTDASALLHQGTKKRSPGHKADEASLEVHR
jgi:hypothetical protein